MNKEKWMEIKSRYDDVKSWPYFKELIEVDKYIITVSVAFIAAHVFLLSASNKPSSKLIGYLVVIAVFFYIAALLSTLWHKVRFKFKKSIFLKGSEIIRDKWNEKLNETVIVTVNSFFNLLFIKNLPKLLQGLPEEFKDKIDVYKFSQAIAGEKLLKLSDSSNESTKNGKKMTINNILNSEQKKVIGDIYGSFKMNSEKEIEEYFDKVFNEPMDEPYSKIRLLLDKISHNSRYLFFVGGMIFSFLSLAFSLIY